MQETLYNLYRMNISRYSDSCFGPKETNAKFIASVKINTAIPVMWALGFALFGVQISEV